MGDSLDVHAALGRDNERNVGGRTVNQDRQVEFFFDVGAVFDVEAVHLLAGGRGLRGHEVFAEHRFCMLFHVFLREGEAHAAFFAGFRLDELALAAATRVDLALHDPERTGERINRFLDVGEREDRHAFCNRRTEGFQQRLGLIFVNVH